ncbi:hypothetical protein D9V80_01670 [Buchnera aphidicola (Thelaxes californica)]|uniref:5'-3' exonuclease domain-containing protein n=1 Tax=Buchnera aphidicola (Thelaxes californica) TaxID=1315998 RepID=A0A4D6YA20_9GAMM|nr:5'-3' exonuclease H3TH domain-containing protein [Buchnera aphidicola]QCI26856.1 hypothetical protein D9V80_01670 [Buchnera aphidicola (Thelaxes californica)]
MINNHKKKVLIIDGHVYFYQSYYAYPLLKNDKGENCGAIYGFLKKIKTLILNFQPKKIIIVFDTPLPTFRHTLFSDYKSNRNKMPSLLQQQIIPLKSIILAMGIPIITLPHVEADDIIGTLTHLGSKKNETILICSNDNDMNQLINKNVIRINNKMKIIGIQEIKKKYEILPQYLPHVSALMGDKSDNIPGIYGIGKKIATILIKKFNTINILYENINIIKNMNIRGTLNIIKNLKEQKKTAFLSLKLVTINNKINIEKKWNELNCITPNIKLLNLFFKQYQFKSWLIDINNNFGLIRYIENIKV